MTSPSLPDNWEDLATGYALGNLSAQEAEELKRLLEEHPELAVEVERSQKTLSLIAQTGLNQPTPPHLRSKILAAASLNQVEHHSTTRQGFPWAILAGSMAAIFILILGYDSYRLRQELKATRQLLREMQRQDRDSQALLTALRQSSVFPLVGDGEAKAAAGTAIINPEDKAIIFVENLPPLPKGEIYRLWAIVATTPEPIFCGQFMTNLEGEIAKSLAPPSEVFNTKISKLVITAEREKTPSDSPQGTIVMQSLL